jgi:type III pantothenate kinase
MNLLVDIGNSRIKWALQEGTELQVGVPLLRGNKPFKDVARPAWKDLEPPARVLVSNVAGVDYEKAVRTWVKRRWKVTPEFVYASRQLCGVTNAYREPERLGADRWAALLAVHDAYPGAAVVVDCGTAVTADAISADGRHLGGLIAPGLELMTSSLTGRAAGIQVAEEDDREISLLGSSTAAGVAGGVLYAAVSLVDRLYADLRIELGKSTQLVMTGGDAEKISALLSNRPVLEPDLVLKGLAVVARSSQVETAREPDTEPAMEAAVCDS